MAVASAGLNGLAAQATPPPSKSDEVAASSSQGEMVASASSPVSARPRPQAPPLNFASTPPPRAPADPARTERDERDDLSVPPVDLDAHFFDGSSGGLFESETRDPRLAMKLTAAAARRRAHLAKYVTAAVGLSSALCVAALLKIAVARNHEELRTHASLGGQAAAAALPLNAERTTEPEPSPSPVANSAPADTAEKAADPPAVAEQPTNPPAGATPDPASAEPPAPPQPAAADPVQPAAAAATPAPETNQAAAAEPLDPKEAAKEAAKEKAQCRRALEWGKVADSIAAGERSVAIDPTDAEAWLLLGAAYQQKGDAKNAVRSFKSCVDQGKRGPKWDCAAMLR